MTHLPKLALFIDGVNFYATARALGFEIDYKRLLQHFQARGTLLRAYYYTTEREDEQERSWLRPLLDWLEYNGFTVVTKPAKEFIDHDTGRRKFRGNMDIDLAIDALELAPYLDQLVLFSGDGDFTRLVEDVQRRGVRVVLVSTVAVQPPMVADELRRQADEFIDLKTLQPEIGRNPAPRDVPQLPQFVQRGAAGDGASH